MLAGCSHPENKSEILCKSFSITTWQRTSCIISIWLHFNSTNNLRNLIWELRLCIRCFAVMRLSSVSAVRIAERSSELWWRFLGLRPTLHYPWYMNLLLSTPCARGLTLPWAHKVICRQIISMTSDRSYALFAIALLWQIYSQGFSSLLVSGELAKVSAVAQLVVLEHGEVIIVS